MTRVILKYCKLKNRTAVLHNHNRKSKWRDWNERNVLLQKLSKRKNGKFTRMESLQENGEIILRLNFEHATLWKITYEKPLKAQVITGGLKFHHMIIRISNSLRNFILTIANFGTLLTYMQNRSRWTTLRVSNTLNNSSVHQYHHQWFL